MERVTQCKPQNSLPASARPDSLCTALLKIIYVRVFTNMVATNWIMEAVFDAADDTLKVKKESGAKRSGTRGPKPFILKSLRQVAASLSYTSRNNVAQVPTGFITGSYKLYSIY